MATKTDRSSARKVTVTLPAPLLTRLDETVPARRRSAFIARAVEERLAVLEQAVALEEPAGAARDAADPDTAADDDVDRWLAALRGSTDRRLARLFAAPAGAER